MSIEEFTDIAYQYFPKGIDNLAEHDKFMNSSEIKNLSNHCMSFSDREQKGNFDNFYERVESLDLSKNFHNATLFIGMTGRSIFSWQNLKEINTIRYA